MLGEKNISKFLRYAGHDLSSLEDKIQKLRSDAIEQEFRKKDLNNTIMLQCAQLSDLSQTITKYQSAIDSKQQQR